MRRPALAAFLALMLLPSALSATWSIIAIDRTTGRIVISSATCAATAPNQLKLLQAIVIPGLGVAAAQAGVDRTHENQKLIFREMQRGTHPTEIIRMLEDDPNIERRQFGIIDMQGRTAGRSGSGNRAVAMDLQGESDDGILWAIQGNIIATEEALTAAATIMQRTWRHRTTTVTITSISWSCRRTSVLTKMRTPSGHYECGTTRGRRPTARRSESKSAILPDRVDGERSLCVNALLPTPAPTSRHRLKCDTETHASGTVGAPVPLSDPPQFSAPDTESQRPVVHPHR